MDVNALGPHQEAEESLYFRYSAALRVFGSIESLDDVTRNLGLTPTQPGYKREVHHFQVPNIKVSNEALVIEVDFDLTVR